MKENVKNSAKSIAHMHKTAEMSKKWTYFGYIINYNATKVINTGSSSKISKVVICDDEFSIRWMMSWRDTVSRTQYHDVDVSS